MCVEVEVELGEVFDIRGCCVTVDIQLVARTVVVAIGGAASAVDDACDAPRKGGVRAADIDGIARRVSAKRTSAVDVARVVGRLRKRS